MKWLVLTLAALGGLLIALSVRRSNDMSVPADQRLDSVIPFFFGCVLLVLAVAFFLVLVFIEL